MLHGILSPRRRMLAGVSGLALAAVWSGPAISDIIESYNFTPVNWVTNNGTTYPADGGTLFGTMTYNWTTGTVVAANFTSTASTDNSWATQTFTSMSTNGGPYTYNGPTYTYNGITYSTGLQYREVRGSAGGQTIFVDFIQGNLSDIFPGRLGSVYTTDNQNGSTQRVLASTVASSLPPPPVAGPIDSTGAPMATSNLGGSLNPDFQGGTLLVVPAATSIANNFTVGAFPGNAIDANGNAASFSGTFTGAGGLTFTDSSGSGQTLTLSNSGGNTYAGLTTVNGATLAAAATNAFSPNSAVVLANAAQTNLALNGFNQTIAGLSGGGANGGNVQLGSATLTVTGGGTFGGVISGSGSYVQANGTEVFTGANTYTGGTTINAGATLQLGNGGTTGSIVGNVADNGALVFNRSDTVAFGGVVSGSGSLTQAAGGLILTGANTYTGGTSIAAGSALQLGNGGTTGSITGDVANAGVLIFNRSDSVTFGGVISGAGSVTQGAGTVILTGANTYTGGTTINADATLQLGNGGTTGSIVGNVADNGVLVFNRSDATSFAGSISGSGSVTQAGGGTVTLTGTNSYTGGTTISAGTTLRLGNGGTSGSIAGNVANAGTLVFNRSDAVTFGGAISGSGSLSQIGSGGLTLTGANTYTGGTSIAAGTGLQLGNGGTSGSIVGNVANSGTLVFNRADSVTFGGVISGSGQLVQLGAGTTVLTGANTYSGGTTILAGTLQLGNGGSTGAIAGNVANAGALVFNRADSVTFGGTISGTGSVTKAGTGTTVLTANNTYTGGTTISGGTLQLGTGGTSGMIAGAVANNGTLVFNRSDLVNFAGSISGTGNLVQAGSGTLVLNANNSVTGLVTVASGRLVVGDTAGSTARLNASAGGVTVATGAVLGGHGTILGAVRNTAGGTVQPGNSIGTLTVGSYTQGANGTLAIEANAQTASRLASVGAANLDGTAAVTFTGGGYTARVYRILTASSVNGGFSTLTQTGAPSGTVYGLYTTPDRTEVDLVLAPTRSAAVYGNVSTQALDNAQAFTGRLFRRLDQDGCDAAQPAGTAMAGQSVRTSAGCEGARLWVQPLGTVGRVGSDGDRFRSSTTGFAAGGDVRLPYGLSLGLAAEYGYTRIRPAHLSSNASLESYTIGAYARAPIGRFTLDAAAFWFGTDARVSRDTQGAGIARSTPGGNGEGGAVRLGYDAYAGIIVPQIGLRYVSYHRDAATERNVGPLGFRINSATNESLRADFGVMVRPTVSVGGVVVTPQAWLGLEQELASTRRNVGGSLAAVSGTDFTVGSASPDRTRAAIDLGISAKVSDGVAVFTQIGGRIGATHQEGTLLFGARFQF